MSQENVEIVRGLLDGIERKSTEECIQHLHAAVVDEIVRARPAAAKGRYLLSITLATSMGPGVRVDTARIREAEILADSGNGAAPEGEEPEPEAEAVPEPVEPASPASRPSA